MISVAKKQVDITNATDDATVRAKAFINKCLNRILTETEVSASHASHFLLGHSDHKTSHSFTRLNLHNALAWLSAEIKRYEHKDYINSSTSKSAFFNFQLNKYPIR